MRRRDGELKGEVCNVETAMWDFSGQILEAGVWTKLQIFQPGMCIVPRRLPTTERGRGGEVKKEKTKMEEGRWEGVMSVEVAAGTAREKKQGGRRVRL